MTQHQEQEQVWLTQEGHDKLQAELAELKGPVRDEVVARIAAARDEGDLKENGGYHAAREEQGKLEGRIRQIEDILSRAEVGEKPADDGVVRPGMKVVVRFGDDSGTEEFLLGAREMAGDADIEVFSPQSALGEAINGQQQGETVSYVAPNGSEIRVEIVEATPYDA